MNFLLASRIFLLAASAACLAACLALSAARCAARLALSAACLALSAACLAALEIPLETRRNALPHPSIKSYYVNNTTIMLSRY